MSEFIWWNSKLTQPERNVLIRLLFRLDLTDYVEYNEKGEIIGLKEVDEGKWAIIRNDKVEL